VVEDVREVRADFDAVTLLEPELSAQAYVLDGMALIPVVAIEKCRGAKGAQRRVHLSLRIQDKGLGGSLL
jgi:hypothetical protein